MKILLKEKDLLLGREEGSRWPPIFVLRKERTCGRQEIRLDLDQLREVLRLCEEETRGMGGPVPLGSPQRR